VATGLFLNHQPPIGHCPKNSFPKKKKPKRTKKKTTQTMVQLRLVVRAELENLRDFGPCAETHWYFTGKCTSCGEVGPKPYSVDAAETVERIRSDAHLVAKCKFCKREMSCELLSRESARLNPDDTAGVHIAVFDFRGMEPVQWIPRTGFSAKGLESGTPFENIDLTDGEFCDYDEKGECSVMISAIESEWVNDKGQKHRKGWGGPE
jgi:hypothetical protein